MSKRKSGGARQAMLPGFDADPPAKTEELDLVAAAQALGGRVVPNAIVPARPEGTVPRGGAVSSENPKIACSAKPAPSADLSVTIPVEDLGEFMAEHGLKPAGKIKWPKGQRYPSLDLVPAH
jgi:hypothetical protein